MGLPSPGKTITTIVNNFPTPPSPAEVVRGAIALVDGVPIEQVIDDKDVAGILILMGDTNDDGTLDVRMIPLRGGPGATMRAMPAMQVGPQNVRVKEALRFGMNIAGFLPAPFQVPVRIALGAVAGACNALEKLALS